VSDTHFLPCSTDVIDDSPSTCAAAHLRNVFTDSVLLENYRMEQAQDHEDGNTIFKNTWRTVTFQFRDVNTVFPCTVNVHAVSHQRRPCTHTRHVYILVSGELWRVPSKFLQCLQLSIRISTTSKRKTDRYIMKVKFSLSISWIHIQEAEVQFHSFLTLAPPDGGQPFILLRYYDKGTTIPVQAWPGLEASRRLKRGKVVSTRQRPPLLPKHIPGKHYC
jgi:hypothetical protein